MISLVRHQEKVAEESLCLWIYVLGSKTSYEMSTSMAIKEIIPAEMLDLLQYP